MNAVVTLEQRVKERINDTIADLLPADEIERLVSLQTQHFMQLKLNELIKTEIEAKMKEAIKACINSPEYNEKWDNCGMYGASEAVKKIITENAADILANMIGGISSQVVMTMRNNRVI